MRLNSNTLCNHPRGIVVQPSVSEFCVWVSIEVADESLFHSRPGLGPNCASAVWDRLLTLFPHLVVPFANCPAILLRQAAWCCEAEPPWRVSKWMRVDTQTALSADDGRTNCPSSHLVVFVLARIYLFGPSTYVNGPYCLDICFSRSYFSVKTGQLLCWETVERNSRQNKTTVPHEKSKCLWGLAQNRFCGVTKRSRWYFFFRALIDLQIFLGRFWNW